MVRCDLREEIVWLSKASFRPLPPGAPWRGSEGQKKATKTAGSLRPLLCTSMPTSWPCCTSAALSCRMSSAAALS
eukprot:scaffold53690_cov58-Phaeocystis_antarctica.AAC.1